MGKKSKRSFSSIFKSFGNGETLNRNKSQSLDALSNYRSVTLPRMQKHNDVPIDAHKCHSLVNQKPSNNAYFQAQISGRQFGRESSFKQSKSLLRARSLEKLSEDHEKNAKNKSFVNKKSKSKWSDKRRSQTVNECDVASKLKTYESINIKDENQNEGGYKIRKAQSEIILTLNNDITKSSFLPPIDYPVEEEEDLSDNIAPGERSVAQSRASVMIYNNEVKKWEHAGGSQGMSRVHVYFNPNNDSYRIVGRKVNDNEVVINCSIGRTLKYNKATATFHQWRDQRQVYGLNFQTADDAVTFSEAVLGAVDLLNNPQGAPATSINISANRDRVDNDSSPCNIEANSEHVLPLDKDVTMNEANNSPDMTESEEEVESVQDRIKRLQQNMSAGTENKISKGVKKRSKESCTLEKNISDENTANTTLTSEATNSFVLSDTDKMDTANTALTSTESQSELASVEEALEVDECEQFPTDVGSSLIIQDQSVSDSNVDVTYEEDVAVEGSSNFEEVTNVLSNEINLQGVEVNEALQKKLQMLEDKYGLPNESLPDPPPQQQNGYDSGHAGAQYQRFQEDPYRQPQQSEPQRQPVAPSQPQVRAPEPQRVPMAPPAPPILPSVPPSTPAPPPTPGPPPAPPGGGPPAPPPGGGPPAPPGGGPPPPPPPPPVAAAPPPPPINGGGGGGGGLAGALAGVQLKKRSEMTEDRRPPAPANPMDDMMSALNKRLQARKKMADGDTPADAAPSAPTVHKNVVPPPSVNKISSSANKAGTMPAAHKSTPPSFNKPTNVVTPVNKNKNEFQRSNTTASNSSSSDDLKAIKDEIMQSVRDEIRAAKEEIIEAMREELQKISR